MKCVTYTDGDPDLVPRRKKGLCVQAERDEWCAEELRDSEWNQLYTHLAASVLLLHLD